MLDTVLLKGTTHNFKNPIIEVGVSDEFQNYQKKKNSHPVQQMIILYSYVIYDGIEAPSSISRPCI